MKRTLFFIVILVVIIILGWFTFQKYLFPWFFRPTPITIETEDRETEISIIATQLEIPWEKVFLPDGIIIITERAGNLKIINGEQTITRPISDVYHIGEGGLLGMTLHPNFSENRYIYLYMTTRQDGQIKNKIDRFTYTKENELINRVNIINDIPGARFHNGGRITFGPDGYLYITTGDAQNTELSQEINSLAGKILRIKEDGGIPEDNPFNNEVYSYGHRNPQGLAWDENNRLWSTEHGPTGNDELNIIEKGKNYGWPIIQGAEIREGMETPIAYSDVNETWAPSGMTYHKGSIFFAGLRGNALFEAKISLEEPKLNQLLVHFLREYGRIRSVKEQDGSLYIITSNTDGRSQPNPSDDKLMRITFFDF